MIGREERQTHKSKSLGGCDETDPPLNVSCDSFRHVNTWLSTVNSWSREASPGSLAWRDEDDKDEDDKDEDKEDKEEDEEDKEDKDEDEEEDDDEEEDEEVS
ncbi:UNVERIFIED_CONTAM: hypothetical protein K2H54_050187 [Gekko kuhli]